MRWALLLLGGISFTVAAQEDTTMALHPVEVKKAPLDFTKKGVDALQKDLERLTRKSGAQLCKITKTPKADCESNDDSTESQKLRSNKT
jgi:hypothetical protein